MHDKHQETNFVLHLLLNYTYFTLAFEYSRINNFSNFLKTRLEKSLESNKLPFFRVDRPLADCVTISKTTLCVTTRQTEILTRLTTKRQRRSVCGRKFRKRRGIGERDESPERQGVQVAHVSDLSSRARVSSTLPSSSPSTMARSEPTKERIVGFIVRPDEIYAHLIKFQNSRRGGIPVRAN